LGDLGEQVQAEVADRQFRRRGLLAAEQGGADAGEELVVDGRENLAHRDKYIRISRGAAVRFASAASAPHR
jgi:hypothetical protein